MKLWRAITLLDTWTEAYTMLMPTGATLDDTYYEKKEKHWERFFYSWEEEEKNITYIVYGLFEDRPDSEEVGLDHLSFFAQYEGEYVKSENGNNIYYFAKETLGKEKEGAEEFLSYAHIGFIKRKDSGKSLGLIYEHNCSDWTTNCDANTERIEEHFWQLVKSVKFDE